MLYRVSLQRKESSYPNPKLVVLHIITIILINSMNGVGVKTDRSRVGGPELCVLGSKVTADRDMMFT